VHFKKKRKIFLSSKTHYLKGLFSFQIDRFIRGESGMMDRFLSSQPSTYSGGTISTLQASLVRFPSAKFLLSIIKATLFTSWREAGCKRWRHDTQHNDIRC
jgi:hypothetical protein